MPRKLPVWLTRAERQRLLNLDLSHRDRAIVVTFLYTGLRSNELRMLDAPDIDFEEVTLLVRHGKRSKQRLLPLHPDAAAALEMHLAGRTTGPVFRTFHGRISNRRLRSLIEQIGREAGLQKKIHPHVLRHTFATSLREAGQELDVIQALLGHERIETTAIYTHCSVDQLRSAIDRI